VQIQEEFEAILDWAAANKMTVNMTKTKEIVFRRPNPRTDLHLFTFPHIEQVCEAKLLGVIFTSNLLWDSHINFILKACSQRSFLLRRLRDQGLTRKQLNIVYDAIIISRIMYASQAWSGFLSRDLIGRINGFFLRMYRYGFCQTIDKFEEISKLRNLLFLSRYCCLTIVFTRCCQQRRRSEFCYGQEGTIMFCRSVNMFILDTLF
jgi:hypothetical protein